MQRWQASAQTRQCSCMLACRWHSSPQSRHAAPQASTVGFAKKLQELKLGVDRIASVHGRTTTIAELDRAMRSAVPST